MNNKSYFMFSCISVKYFSKLIGDFSISAIHWKLQNLDAKICTLVSSKRKKNWSVKCGYMNLWSLKVFFFYSRWTLILNTKYTNWSPRDETIQCKGWNKNTSDGIRRKLDISEGKIGELEDRTMESIQTFKRLK